MIGELPTALIVNGKSYPIESDFRIVLNLFAELDSKELSDFDKAYLTVRTMYCDTIPNEDFIEADRKSVV